MSLSVERAVSILPLGQYPPPGVPIGTHAFVLKMTPEALQELANQLAAQQPAGAAATTSAIGTAPGSSQSTKPGQSRQSGETQKKNEKPLMQLVVSESGQVSPTRSIAHCRRSSFSPHQRALLIARCSPSLSSEQILFEQMRPRSRPRPKSMHATSLHSPTRTSRRPSLEATTRYRWLQKSMVGLE